MDKHKLTEFIEGQLSGTDYYLVDLKITPTNEITVEIDSDGYADIEKCIELNRAIEEAFSRDEEDYELEVGTAGITAPLKIFRQYKKYIGQELEVLTTDGRKLYGLLKEADPEKGIVLEIEEKVKHEGAKRPVIEKREIPLAFSEIKRANYLLRF